MTDTMTASIDVEAFARGFLECAAWLAMFDPETDGEEAWSEHLRAVGIDYRNGEAMARHLLSMADHSVATALLPDCAEFCRSNMVDLIEAEAMGREADSLGHDFYLSRNGHGAGFWDRGLGEVGQRLHEASKVYGECGIQAWLEGGASDVLARIKAFGG